MSAACCASVFLAHTLSVGGGQSEHVVLTWGRGDPYILSAAVVAAAAARFAPSPGTSVLASVPIGTLSPGDFVSDGPFTVRLTVDRTAKIGSDVLLYGSLIGAVAATPLEYSWGDGSLGRDLGRAGIAFEALGTTYALTEAGKKAFARPRPYTALDPAALAAANPHGAALAEGYSQDESGAWHLEDPDAVYSLPSGHTSMVAAGAFTFTSLALFSMPDHKPAAYLWYAAPTTLTVLVGYARVRASMHHPTDVIAGGVLGAACGVLIPAAHLRRPGRGRSAVLDRLVVSVDSNGVQVAGDW